MVELAAACLARSTAESDGFGERSEYDGDDGTTLLHVKATAGDRRAPGAKHFVTPSN